MCLGRSVSELISLLLYACLQLLRSTLGARRETFGEYSQSLASAYKLLGSVHMSQGNMERSLKSMNKVCLLIAGVLKNGME